MNEKVGMVMGESYKQIAWLDQDCYIKNGSSVEFSFDVNPKDVKKRHRIFFRGESSLFYMWRSEPDCVGEYLSIDDCLNRQKAEMDTFCLDLSSESEVIYRKTAYKKLSWPPKISYLATNGRYTPDWKWGIFAKAKNLQFKENGFVRYKAEVYYVKENEEKVLAMIPDEEYTLSLESGSYPLTELSGTMHLPLAKISHVDFLLEGEGYTGEVYLEHPFMQTEKIPNVLHDFAPAYPMHEHYCWAGINLSEKEWPKFLVTLNGETVFYDRLMERAHRYSEFEFDLPENSVRVGENTISLMISPEYPFSFRLKEIGCFTYDDEIISLVSCPETAYLGEECKILIRTKKPNTEVRIQNGGDILYAEPQFMPKAGLNVFTVRCLKPMLHTQFSLSTKGASVSCVIERIVGKQTDDILTGSGDMIYINHEKWEDVENYLSWYLGNHVGNMVTVRNVYRWGGGRRLVPEVWKRFASLLSDLNVKYPHIMDGRDLPGMYCNPTPDMMAGTGYLGRQHHEMDGQFCYWQADAFRVTGKPILEAKYDLYSRMCRENIEISDIRENYTNYKEDETGKYFYHLPDTTDDMEVAAKNFIHNLKEIKFDTTRHTGPTTLFKYFYQAGFDWTGAELMYSAQEPLGAAIRGAAYCYDKPRFGSHLAVQWSTDPHDTEDKKKRYRLALYTAYMQGYAEINTEEGFWHIEQGYYAFSRNDVACQNLLKQQQDFYRYVSLNSRVGEHYTSFSFLSGRYDGWRSWGKDSVWGQKKFQNSAVEQSWNLLNLFYPLSPIGKLLYKRPCPDDQAIGYYTGTPRGQVDILPIEATLDKMRRYKTLAFVGYHKGENSDCEKLLSYMQAGGNVIMGWPHLSITTKRVDVVSGKHTYLKNDFVSMIATGEDFGTEYVDGKPVTINRGIKMEDAEVLLATDSSIPFLIRKQIGDGNLWFINAAEYPAEEPVYGAYAMAISTCSDQQNQQEKAFVSCGEDVQFSIYQTGAETSDIYLLAVDWYRKDDVPRKAKLRIGNGVYDVEIPFGVLLKVSVCAETAAWVDSEEVVVTALTEEHVTLSGSGEHTLFLIKDGTLNRKTISFDKTSRIDLQLD